MKLALFWPGLPSAWYRGMTSGLVVSVAYAWWLCWLLMATFWWPEWVNGWVLLACWIAASLVSVGSWCRSQFTDGMLARPDSENETAELARAQREYLRGNWFEAEAIALQILQRRSDDVPAGLLVAGVLRHTGRLAAAKRKLEQLKLFDAASAWQFEIHHESRLVEKARQEAKSKVGSGDATEQDSA